ncbi:MAG: hypothetical protein ABIK36_06425 [Pseudomonadota bacterium]
MSAMSRRQVMAEADEILRANPAATVATRIRYRGGRPALNWLAKQDEKGAAALWRIASTRLPSAANDNIPVAANDNNADAKGLGVDRRKDGKPRGKKPNSRSIEAYLAMPAVQPRLGDAEPSRTRVGNWDGASRGVSIKSQEWIYPDAVFTHETRLSFHPPAIAPGAFFLGSVGGLGQPKIGKQRGDIRRVDEGTVSAPPDEIDIVVETVLARGNLADVGRALGAKGGYADRKGRAALLAAGKWAVKALAS